MAYSQGDVVLVPFPFRDQHVERTRPAVVVSVDAYHQLGDLVVAAVTSHPPRNDFDTSLVDWEIAGLKFPSTVRTLLATIAQGRVQLRVGHLSERDWKEVLASLHAVFGWVPPVP